LFRNFHNCGKPFTSVGSESYTGTEARSLLHEEADNCLIEKLTRQDATNSKQKTVTDYKEQADRQLPPPPPPPPPPQKKKKKKKTKNKKKKNKMCKRTALFYLITHRVEEIP